MESQVNKAQIGRPLKYNPKYMDDKLTEYIDKCTADKSPVTITGYCQYIGTNRETLGDYADREDFSDIIKRLRGAAEACLVDYMLSGKNPAGAIFLAKNHFSYSDKQDININNTHSLMFDSPEQAAQMLSGMAQMFSALAAPGTPAEINVTPEPEQKRLPKGKK